MPELTLKIKENYHFSPGKVVGGATIVGLGFLAASATYIANGQDFISDIIRVGRAVIGQETLSFIKDAYINNGWCGASASLISLFGGYKILEGTGLGTIIQNKINKGKKMKNYSCSLETVPVKINNDDNCNHPTIYYKKHNNLF